VSFDWSYVVGFLGVLAFASLIIDGFQTHAIATRPSRYSEIGFAQRFIGKKPDPGDVVVYFLLWIGVVTLLAYVTGLAHPALTCLVFVIVIGVQYPALKQNYKLFGGRILP